MSIYKNTQSHSHPTHYITLTQQQTLTHTPHYRISYCAYDLARFLLILYDSLFLIDFWFRFMFLLSFLIYEIVNQ